DDVDGRTKVATTIKEYKQAVQDYKHSASKETKKIVNEKLAKLKGDIQEVVEGFLFKEDKKSEILLKEIAKLRKEQKKITSLEANEKIAKQISEKSKQITLQTLGDIKDSNIFENSMEWMIEFPELLNEDGSFQGFDIVIANPPYIDSEAMVNSGQTEFRDFIIKNYKIARGNWDIYIAFFNLAFRLINEKGNLSFITPDKWLSKPFGMELRKTYLDNISAVARAGRDVFTSAKVDSILTFISKSTTTKIEVLNCIDKKFKTLHKIDKKDFEEPYILDFIFSEQLSILLKMEKDNIKLSDYTVCENACATSDCYDLKDILKNLENQKITSKHLKVINTGTVGKYISRWGEKEMTYLKDRYLYPIVDEEDFNKSFKNSYATKTFMPKIIIKGLTLLDACFDFDGRVIPGKSTLVICEKDINKLKFIAAIINSKLPLFYIKEKYASSSYNGGINFTKDMINNFPIPKITDADQKKLVNLVDTILDTKNKNPNADTSSIETQIDDEVYKLYSITPQEKNIIEANE
ncbi:MAG: Eco57I restriction-modification methylase domain-containing protein, partial [Bacteroidaceae bacterium]|nr:Eco57I restriction-modification methylase domain-containing protein [Bacteroidaceae bacterium]